MQTEKYTYLIYQQLQGSLSSAEEKALTEWLKASPENKKIREEIVASMNMLDDYEPSFSIDVESDYGKIKEQMEVSKTVSKLSQKTKTFSLSSRRRWLSAAATFLLLAVASFFFWKNQTTAEEWMVLKTAVGEKQNITLTDGSKVWLNENTIFKYKAQFSGKNRPVQLSGEAFFDITPNPNQPFIIETEKSKVQVLGTSFNVKAYEHESTNIVIVKTGKVIFTAKGFPASTELHQKQQAILTTTDNQIVTSDTKNLNSIAWQTNQLSFKNESLTDIFKTLEKHFQVEIICTNKSLKNCLHSMTPRTLDLEKFFDNLNKVYKIKVVKENDKKYVISGGNC